MLSNQPPKETKEEEIKEGIKKEKKQESVSDHLKRMIALHIGESTKLAMSPEEINHQMQIAKIAIQQLPLADLILMKSVFSSKIDVNALLVDLNYPRDPNPEHFFVLTGLNYNLPYYTEGLFKRLNVALKQKENSTRFLKFLLTLSPDQNNSLIDYLTKLIQQKAGLIKNAPDFIELLKSVAYGTDAAFDLLKHKLLDFINSPKELIDTFYSLDLGYTDDDAIQTNVREKLAGWDLTASQFIPMIRFLSVKNCADILNDHPQILDLASPTYIEKLSTLLHFLKMKDIDLPYNVLLKLPENWQTGIQTIDLLSRITAALSDDQISFIWCDHLSNLVTSSLCEFISFLRFVRIGNYVSANETATVVFNCLNTTNPEVWTRFIKTIDDLNHVTQLMIPYISFKLCQQLLGTVIKTQADLAKIENIEEKNDESLEIQEKNHKSLEKQLAYLIAKDPNKKSNDNDIARVSSLGKFAPPPAVQLVFRTPASALEEKVRRP